MKKKIAVIKKPNLTKAQTRVGYEQTVQEIQKHLIRAGAKKIIFDYDEASIPCNITFSYPIEKSNLLFSLPIRFNGINKILDNQKTPRHTGDMQAINTGWRIMKEWIISQLALVESEMAELPEVFLPYSITKSGETLYEVFKNNDQTMLLLQ